MQQAIFGRLLSGTPDALPGYTLVPLAIADPDMVALSGQAVHGMARPSGDRRNGVRGIVFKLSEAELASADAYEVAAMKRIEMVLASGLRAFVYVGAED